MKPEAFYDKEFSYGNSSITRGELESLPCPFCTANVTDEEMQIIIDYTHQNTCDTHRLRYTEPIDFENDRISATWWEKLEEVCQTFMPYYEDLEDSRLDSDDEEAYHYGLKH